MKRLVLVTATAAVMLLGLVVPAFAASITQTPDTTGMTLEAGSSLTISWTSAGLPADALLTLMCAHPEPDGTLSSYSVATDLPLQGSCAADVPTSDGWYFYYLHYYQPVSGGFILTRSNAYLDYEDGHGWWFRVGALGEPSITQLPVLAGGTYRQGQQVLITWTSDYLDPDARLTLIQEYSEPDGTGDGEPIATGLPQSGGYLVTIPQAVELRKYSYYLCSEWSESGPSGVFSDGFDGWFDVIPPQAIAITTPTVTPGTPRPKRAATFRATVTPVSAAGDVTFTLHLLRWETRRVDGVRTPDYYERLTVPLSAVDVSNGIIGAVAKLPARGDWKMYVTCDTGMGYVGTTSDATFFTAK